MRLLFQRGGGSGQRDNKKQPESADRAARVGNSAGPRDFHRFPLPGAAASLREQLSRTAYKAQYDAGRAGVN